MSSWYAERKADSGLPTSGADAQWSVEASFEHIPLGGLEKRASDLYGATGVTDDDELRSEYIDDDQLDVERWAHDSLVFALPDKILCRDDCAGMCPHCGIRLEPGAVHECGTQQLDTRWAKLRDLL